MALVGRNAPCPCGSGAKYKKCCLAQDEREAAPYNDEARRLGAQTSRIATPWRWKQTSAPPRERAAAYSSS